MEIAGDACIFVNPDDVKSIQEALQKLIYQKSNLEDMIIKGLKNSLRFSWESSANKFLTILKNL